MAAEAAMTARPGGHREDVAPDCSTNAPRRKSMSRLAARAVVAAPVGKDGFLARPPPPDLPPVQGGAA